MGRNPRVEAITDEMVVQAIKDTFGVVTAAAERLGMARDTLHGWIREEPKYQAALAEAREITLDVAESKLFQAIAAGDMKAITFYLRCFGKRRGYVDSLFMRLPLGPDAPQLPAAPATEDRFREIAAELTASI